MDFITYPVKVMRAASWALTFKRYIELSFHIYL